MRGGKRGRSHFEDAPDVLVDAFIVGLLDLLLVL
jgi:hypothetical protein